MQSSYQRLYFRLAPNSFLNNLSFPTLLFYILFYPLTLLIIKLSNWLLRLFFGELGKEKPEEQVFSKVDLDNLVNEVNDEKLMNLTSSNTISGSFRMHSTCQMLKLSACMVPRTEIVALPVDSTHLMI